jgi:hypothetical protein
MSEMSAFEFGVRRRETFKWSTQRSIFLKSHKLGQENRDSMVYRWFITISYFSAHFGFSFPLDRREG